MLETIGDSTVRFTTRSDNNMAVEDKDVNNQRVEKIREERPVEKSDEGARADLEENKNEKTSKYQLEKNKIVFEKYNKNGEVILRIPPAQKPVDEIA